MRLAQRRGEQRGGVDFCDDAGLAELALLEFGGGEFTKDGDWIDPLSRARAPQPGSNPHLEAQRCRRNHGAREFCEQGLQERRAFDFVKERIFIGVQCGGAGVTGEAEGEAGVLFHFGGRAGEDGAEFEGRRTALTSRCRLCASMEAMPGARAGRSMPASSLSGLPMGTPPFALKVAASSAETKLLETASLKPRARRVSRSVRSCCACGSSRTVPEKAGSVSAKRL